jgi:hypothetical protein
MSASSQQNNEPAVMSETTETSSNCDPGNKAGETIAATAFQSFWSLSRTRRKKILRVRRQLVQGRYSLDERLNAVLDRLLEDLVA